MLLHLLVQHRRHRLIAPSSVHVHKVFSQRSSRRFGASPRRGDSEGPQNLHLLHSTASSKVTYLWDLPFRARGALKSQAERAPENSVGTSEARPSRTPGP